MISVYNSEIQINAGPRKIEMMNKYIDIIKKGRCDPCWFIETFFGVTLTDYQTWIIQSAWTKKTVVLVCSRNTGKSFIAGIYIPARAILFPSSKIFIMSNTGDQAQDTFQKMEDIAKRNIQSIKGGFSIFTNEVVKNTTSDGFLHGKSQYSTSLYNNSEITTLVGKAENVVGKRSNLNLYDEAALISENFFTRTEPFTLQSKGFITGQGVSHDIYPEDLPNQNIYLSSAGDTGGHLWEMYKYAATRMMMGYDDCFVADINCEIPLNPTIRGVKQPPMFERSEVDRMMKVNPYRGLREYFNYFDQNGGTDVLLPRQLVTRNEIPYLPEFKGADNPDIHYGLFYDPAHQADNSFVLVCEYSHDDEMGWQMRIVNGINLVQVLPDGSKKPMKATDQLEWIRRLMIAYNGKAEDYKNIKLYIDPGAGGGGLLYKDFLLEDWIDNHSTRHRGVICMERDDTKADIQKFPAAIQDVLYMPDSIRFRTDMFCSITDMVSQDVVKFTPPLPNNGVLKLDDGSEYALNSEQIRAMLEIDLVKEETFAMRKTRNDLGHIKIALAAEKASRMHDDRAYTFAMACFYLQKLRHDEQYARDIPKQDMSCLIDQIGKRNGGQMHKPGNNPFRGRANPFRR